MGDKLIWFLLGCITSFTFACTRTEDLWHNKVEANKCEPDIIFIEVCPEEPIYDEGEEHGELRIQCLGDECS